MRSNPFLDGALRVLRRGAHRALDRAVREARRKPGRARDENRRRDRSPRLGDTYPGDYDAVPSIVYNPHKDGLPDPGEIVWTWVPYEEDHTRGKDRPVLLIGRDGQWLLGLQVTSQDHDRDAAQEARAGRYWTDIGTGEWDSQRRPSEVRVNRIIRINPDSIRRIGAVLDERHFDAVAAEVRRHY